MNEKLTSLGEHQEVLKRYGIDPAKAIPMGQAVPFLWGMPAVCRYVEVGLPHPAIRELFSQKRMSHTLLWMQPRGDHERLLVNGELTLFPLRDLHISDDASQHFSYEPQLWSSKAFHFVNENLGSLMLVKPWSQDLHQYRRLQDAAMDLKDLDLEITPAVLDVWHQRMHFNYHYYQLDGASYRHGKERDEWFKLKAKHYPALAEVIKAVDRKRSSEMPA